MATQEQVGEAARRLDADVFFYSGPIKRADDLSVVDEIGASQRAKRAILILVTGGGDPDAAYKIARYIQSRYDHFTVLVPGICKSAGTLLALGAHEIVFMPYGELGPLDIQVTKIDRFEQVQSGLIITESLDTLELRAKSVFMEIARDLMAANPGLISFASASSVAVEAMKAIYGPVLKRIDPEEIGARSRAMRIAQDYGERLASVSRNLKENTLQLLAEKYSSHSFVIDAQEALELFNNVRQANDAERSLVTLLGENVRYPPRDVLFFSLHTLALQEAPEANNDEDAEAGSPAGDVGNSEAPNGAPIVEAAPGDAAAAAAELDVVEARRGVR